MISGRCNWHFSVVGIPSHKFFFLAFFFFFFFILDQFQSGLIVGASVPVSDRGVGARLR